MRRLMVVIAIALMPLLGAGVMMGCGDGGGGGGNNPCSACEDSAQEDSCNQVRDACLDAASNGEEEQACDAIAQLACGGGIMTPDA